MSRKRKVYGSYRAPPLPRQMERAGKAVTEAKAGKELYAEEYSTRGILRMEVFQELVQSYISGIKTSPHLTSEQKAIAVKEFFRRFREGLSDFMMSVRAEAESYASSFVIPTPTLPAKPSASPAGGLYV